MHFEKLVRRAYRVMGRPARLASVYRRITGKGRYASDQWIRMIACWVDGFEGKRVLEVGCDFVGSFSSEISRVGGAREVVGINPALSASAELRPGCRIEPADARSLAYPDEHFDVVVSSSAFEHIHNLDAALAEIRRVLKRGGFLFSHWGPIWSTSYGHHLWLRHEDRIYNYHNVILPPWCHLLMAPRELGEYLEGRYPDVLRKKIVEYVYHSSEQNQLWFDDYEKIIDASGFEVLLFKGYDTEDGKRYAELVTPSLLEQLRERFPQRTGFGYEGITALLRKH